MIRHHRAEDGVVVLTMDDPAHSTNTMNDAYVRAMADIVERLEAERDQITGVIVTSAKNTFFAGGDLHALTRATAADAPAVFEQVETVKAQLRRLETLGRPVVAAINGSALGGGLEIALACHHRIVVDGPGIEIGLPEVTLGLLPGAGGVTRTVRMLGIRRALLTVLLEGPRMQPAHAREAGLVDELVGSPDELLPAARAWLRSAAGDEEAATQPWDRSGHRLPDGTPSSPELARLLPAFPANLRKQLKGAPYRAPRHILSAAVEGAQVDFETASRIESRYLVDLVTGRQFKDMAQAFFFDLRHISSGGSRPSGVPAWRATTMAVLGAGMMGAGIAYVAARAGIEVVLRDVSVEAAERGRSQAASLLDRQVEQGRISGRQRAEILSRITPTGDLTDAAGCEVVVEAVFERRQLKQQVLADVEGHLAPDALLCSNTSTLPITDLGTGVRRPEDFLGLHFFSPVHKMPLVEIIKGERTGERALARAHDLVRQLGKTPIVVNDSRGFFTSRVFGTLVLEAAAMVGEGVHPVTIERAATQAGFPAPPLAMIDEVTLTLSQQIRDEARASAESSGAAFRDHPGMAVIDRMVALGRTGRSSGGGFYDYPDGGQKQLWPGLVEHFAPTTADVAFGDLQERFTFAMSLETVRCLDEGVLTSVPDGNIGSILGIGFPPLHGGALQYVNGYDGGLPGFVTRARELAAGYGDRFDPPAVLLRMSEQAAQFR